MPKRKATGPVDSDGDDDGDQFYSFPSTPVNFGGGGGLHRPVIAKSLQAGLTIKNQQSCATTTAPSESSSTATRSSLSSTSGGSGNPEFVRTMRDLNKTFHNAVRSSIMKNSSNSLVPLVKDYLFHSRVLMEQFKKGGTQVGLMNGVDLPPKTLKSLGEFFDDFEMRFVENNQPETINLEAETSQETNSALISNFSPPKSTFSSNFSLSTSMPKPTTDNNNFKAPMTSDSATMKFGSLADNSTLNTTNKLDAEKSSSTSGFFTQKIPSVPNPLKVGPATKPLLDPAPPAVKPFSGFSFFAPPPPPPPSGAPPATVTSAGESQTNDEDGEEDEPPKVEITPVKEDDAVYSIRCKIFGVVDGKPKDKGIGMLYIKKLDDGRYQVVVRADNNLGTVILNILLQKSLPLEKNGKNSIMTMDLQANNQKGMPIFIRVKTEDDAEELLKKLKEYQQSSS